MSSSTRQDRRISGTAGLIALMAVLAFTLITASTSYAADPIYVVNAGGPSVSASPMPWSTDSSLLPSPFVNSTGTKNRITSTTATIDTSDPSVPAGTQASLFQDERWDPVGNQEMQWDFPVTDGQQYKVSLYFVENYSPNFGVGKRIFNVSIEGQVVLPNFDVYAAAGTGNKGIVKTFTVTSNANLDIDFTHGAVENPAVSAISVTPVAASPTANLASSPAAISGGSTDTGTTKTTAVELTNTAAAGGASLTINNTSITGADAGSFSDSFNDASSVTLAPGASTTVNVTFAPATPGSKSATLVINHTGANSPLSIPLTATATTPVTPAAGVFVNAGGPATASGSTTWLQDTLAAPSSYVNATATKNKVASTNATIKMSDPSIPSGMPASLFQTERYDPTGGAEMQWDVPTTAGLSYTVNLYFAETFTGAQVVGGRKFDVKIDGVTKLSGYDIFADVGANTAVRKSFTITSDGNTDIDFGHIVENPVITALEVVPATSAPTATLSASPTTQAFGSVNNGATNIKQVVLTANGGPVKITGTTLSGAGAGDFTDSFDDTQSTTLSAGQSLTLNVTFHPVAAGSKTATLSIDHNGSNTPLLISLSGTGVAPGGGGGTTIGFGKSLLQGQNTITPTALQFGPDGRLYVATFSGAIFAYTIQRNSANSYAVTATEQINLVRNIPNHDDDGTPNPSVNTRLVTGLFVAGTATSPVVYVTSSDPRIGSYGDGTVVNLDTNSSMISKLTKSGTAWTKQDLVRGLPRSKENHSFNGLTLDPASNTLYVTASSNTNQGGPSNSFANLPEYALGTGIMAVDLTAIGTGTYDVPTLDDETRAGTTDANDPFGGDDGKNQGRLVAGAPISFYATGVRNPYKVIIGSNGKMYVIDNGGNAGWGGPPVNEGPEGTCTNGPASAGATEQDKLFVVHQGDYFGHPNPTRGNMANTFNSTNPQSPVSNANPAECDFLTPEEAGALTTFSDSTNGFVEYTASNFGGALKGDLIAPLYNGNSINRVDLDAAGTTAKSNTTLFNTVGQRPLDIATQGDDGPFHGVLFVADLAQKSVVIYEPNDFDGTSAVCTGAYSATLDEDNDGYTNADEIDNGTSPCSSADAPADHDHDGTSDLNDPDDDNDDVPDAVDAFAIDPGNGLQNNLPLALTFDNDQAATGLLGLNWTGLMTNGSSNWLTQFDETKMTAGGAGGLMTVDEVPKGDATGAANDQLYAFQAGVNVNPASTNQFTVQTRLIPPYFGGTTPQDRASQGVYLGTGDQDNYIKVAISANGGAGGVQVVREAGGTVTSDTTSALALSSASDYIDLYITVDADAGTAQASYRATSGATHGARVEAGPVMDVPSGWLANATKGLAVGAIATSAGASPTFPANWDFVRAVTGDGSEL